MDLHSLAVKKMTRKPASARQSEGSILLSRSGAVQSAGAALFQPIREQSP